MFTLGMRLCSYISTAARLRANVTQRAQPAKTQGTTLSNACTKLECVGSRKLEIGVMYDVRSK